MPCTSAAGSLDFYSMSAQRFPVVSRGLVGLLVVALGWCAVGCGPTPVGPSASDRRSASRERDHAYGEGWPAVHADAANSDYSPVAGSNDLELAWQRHFNGSVRVGGLPWTINLGPTSTSDGQLYLTSSVTGCHLQALDAASGATRWCAPQVGQLAVASSPLLDTDGRAFLADGTAMHAFDRDGHELWNTPIDGVPFSAQFTPRGRLVFVTHLGIVYVLDRRTGRPVTDPVPLAPPPTWEPTQGVVACARGPRPARAPTRRRSTVTGASSSRSGDPVRPRRGCERCASSKTVAAPGSSRSGRTRPFRAGARRVLPSARTANGST